MPFIKEPGRDLPEIKPNFLDKAISFFSPTRGVERLRSRAILALTGNLFGGYRGADTGRLRADWALGRTNTTAPAWTLQVLRNRTRDLNRNDPVSAGATDTMAINIVGQGLRPQSKLRAAALGITEDKARDLQRQIEGIWETWTHTADSGNRLDFDELQFLALRKIVEDGEILAIPAMADESWRPLKRVVELIETDRLNALNARTAVGNTTGVEVGDRGQPLRYWISPVDYKNQVAGAYNITPPIAIDALDSQGRPKVIHCFRTVRPGQLRGVPFFAPALTMFKDLADYLEAEVVASRVAACLAIFITREDPAMGAIVNAADDPQSGKRVEAVEPGMISYLAPGEGIHTVDPKRGGETFNAFVEGVLRLIGVSLGLPYELLVKDFSKTNYSSARAALLEGRRQFTTWRHWFGGKFCRPIWELVIEEAYLRGMLDLPDFYENRTEYLRAAWVGGSWGWVDPQKEILASKLAIDFGLSTYSKEVAGQGGEWDELFQQRKREQDRIKELGLIIPDASSKAMQSSETAPPMYSNPENPPGKGEGV